MNMKKILFLLFGTALLFSCSAPKSIPYFQDADSLAVSKIAPRQIYFQPEDKLSIIINCKDNALMNLFNLPFASKTIGSQTSLYGAANNQGISGYIIDGKGEIDFPVIGKIKISGLTRDEVAIKIKYELESRNLVKDPIVTVEFMNLGVSVLGEVRSPGRYGISRDHMTIVDAISLAGDLTITGRRENVKVIREKDGEQQIYSLNLCSLSELMNSPAYYLQQNDVVYVEPNEMKKRQSTVNGNTVLSTAFWISVASLAASLCSTIVVVLNNTK